MRPVRIATHIAMVLFAWLAITGCNTGQVASNVSPSTIRSIKIGMTEQQVIAILGQPLRKRPWGEMSILYDYAVPGWGTSGSLWIHFEQGAVRLVRGERQSTFGRDYAVYEVRSDRAIFESPDFEATFARAP